MCILPYVTGMAGHARRVSKACRYTLYRDKNCIAQQWAACGESLFEARVRPGARVCVGEWVKSEPQRWARVNKEQGRSDEWCD